VLATLAAGAAAAIGFSCESATVREVLQFNPELLCKYSAIPTVRESVIVRRLLGNL